jgi:hypothetical protein
MMRRTMIILASALLAGSLLATDAQARGGGGGHMGGFGGHMGGFRGHIGLSAVSGVVSAASAALALALVGELALVRE